MDRSLERRLGSFYYIAVPFAVAVFCVILSMIPMGLSSGIIIAPSFALMAVFYWALYRPDLMPPYMVFLVGLAQDLLSGGPLGLWALTYLVVYGLVVSQRLFFIGRAFFAIWFGFGVIALVAATVMWIVSCLYYGMVLSPFSALVQAIISFILYPLMGRIFAGIQRRLLSQQ